jgi:hypothetical protein
VSSQFDLLAASLRADAVDLEAFVEALAVKLNESFPARVRVERKGGLMRSKQRVRKLVVELGDNQYEVVSSDGHVGCVRRVMVRGIALRSEQMPLERWIDELSAELVSEADKSEADRVALERMLEA